MLGWKRGVVKTLMHRADTIVSDERDMVEERQSTCESNPIKHDVTRVVADS